MTGIAGIGRRVLQLSFGFIGSVILLAQVWAAPARTVAPERPKSLCSNNSPALWHLADESLKGTETLMRERRLSFRYTLAGDADIRAIWAAWLRRSGPNHAIVMLAKTNDGHCAILIDGSGVRAVAPSPAGSKDLAALHAQWRDLASIDGVFRGVRAATPKAREPDRNSITRGMAVEARGADVAAETQLLGQLFATAFPGDIADGLRLFSKVYVLPYEGLGSMPFSALRHPKTGKALTDTTEVSILPSAEILFRDAPDVLMIESKISDCKAKQAAAWAETAEPFSPLVVGNPKPSSDSEFDFPDLPGAQREAAFIGRLLAVRVLGGTQATGPAFLSRARVSHPIHVASHGIADSDEPLRAALVLADGRLTEKVIQEDCFAAKLVVLSACQTGLGGVTAGGVIGVARGFQKAGADEVIMSLWSVDDEATVALMQDFWTHYHSGPFKKNASAALRKAKLAARQRNPRTDLWAGFEVFGAPAPANSP